MLPLVGKRGRQRVRGVCVADDVTFVLGRCLCLYAKWKACTLLTIYDYFYLYVYPVKMCKWGMELNKIYLYREKQRKTY